MSQGDKGVRVVRIDLNELAERARRGYGTTNSELAGLLFALTGEVLERQVVCVVCGGVGGGTYVDSSTGRQCFAECTKCAGAGVTTKTEQFEIVGQKAAPTAEPAEKPAEPLPVIWTAEQVAALNDFQRSGRFHPFTCGGEGRTDKAIHGDGEGVLVATRRGWICPYCDYTQTWAHDFMFRGGGFIQAVSDAFASVLKPAEPKVEPVKPAEQPLPVLETPWAGPDNIPCGNGWRRAPRTLVSVSGDAVHGERPDDLSGFGERVLGLLKTGPVLVDACDPWLFRKAEQAEPVKPVETTTGPGGNYHHVPGSWGHAVAGVQDNLGHDNWGHMLKPLPQNSWGVWGKGLDFSTMAPEVWYPDVGCHTGAMVYHKASAELVAAMRELDDAVGRPADSTIDVDSVGRAVFVDKVNATANKHKVSAVELLKAYGHFAGMSGSVMQSLLSSLEPGKTIEPSWYRSQWPIGVKTGEIYELPCDDTGRRGGSWLRVLVDEQGDVWLSMQQWEDMPEGQPDPIPGIRIRTLFGGGRNRRSRQALLWLADAIRRDRAEQEGAGNAGT